MINLLSWSDPASWLKVAGAIEAAGGHLLQKVRPNILQRRAVHAWLARYRAGKPCRIVGLKPRKRGFSTISTAIHYWMLRTAPTKLGLLGHQDNASTQVLYRMLETFRDHDRNAPGWGNRPTKSATDEMKFSHGSLVTRLTAENPAKVRSQTLQAISATEWAFWPHSELVLQAAMNAMPKEGFSSFIGESTPKGITGSFYTTYKGARWPTAAECPDQELYWKKWEQFLPDAPSTGIPESELFIRIFAAWFEFESSFLRLTAAEERAIKESIDQEDWYLGEQELIDRYLHKREDGVECLGKEVTNCTVWEQLAWRRLTIKNDCDNSRRSFDEEFPSDPLSCFLSSGYPFFDPESVTTLDQVKTLSPPPDTGILDWKDRDERAVTWRDARGDPVLFHIWEHPIEGCAYIVAIDSATGENNVKGGNPDRHSILVFRRPYRDSVGRIHRVKLVARVRPPCLVPLHTAGEWAARLATYYQALTVPEINNTGQAIVQALRRWPQVVVAQRSSMEDPRTGRRQKKVLVGHLTDESTRQAILDHLHRALRAEYFDIRCPNAIYELRIFANDPDEGRPQAPENEHDDDVMATAIALHWLDQATPYSIASLPRQDIFRDHASRQRRGATIGDAMRS